MHHDVDGFRLQQPRDGEGRPAGRYRGDEAGETHPHDAGIRGGPLQGERADQPAALRRYPDVQRVDVPGDMTRGTGSWIAMSLCCTTTGAVAVRPPELVTCTVPWPVASATTTPFWSTLAMSGRRDFHVTATGAAGEPSSRSARGNTRVFSDGSRYTVGGSIRSTAAGPEPTTWPAKASPLGGA